MKKKLEDKDLFLLKNDKILKIMGEILKNKKNDLNS
jgi:hypothetical protein